MTHGRTRLWVDPLVACRISKMLSTMPMEVPDTRLSGRPPAHTARTRAATHAYIRLGWVQNRTIRARMPNSTSAMAPARRHAIS